MASGGGRYASLQYIKDFSSVYAQLQKMDTRLGGSSLADFMSTEVYPYLRARVVNRFDNQGDETVGKWGQLRETTQNIRSSAGYGATGPINRRTGELESYILNAVPAVVITEDSVLLNYPGSLPTQKRLLDKYTTAQRGKAKPRTAPRPVVGLGAADLAAIQVSLENYIMTRGAL